MLLLVVMGAAVLLSSGAALAVTKQCSDKGGYGKRCFGTDGADKLRGTAQRDIIYGRGGNDTIVAFGGTDGLYGEEGNDTLRAGAKGDYLVGGPGDDALDGGDAGDSYNFPDEGWGQDRIIDTVESGSDERGDNRVSFGPKHSGGVVVNLASDSGPAPEVESKGDGSTVDWDGDVVDMVSDSSGDDTINGNGAPNRIFTQQGGTDTVSGGDGDDYISVADFSGGGDMVECGGGYDTVRRDPPGYRYPGDPGDAVSADCENVEDIYAP